MVEPGTEQKPRNCSQAGEVLWKQRGLTDGRQSRQSKGSGKHGCLPFSACETPPLLCLKLKLTLHGLYSTPVSSHLPPCVLHKWGCGPWVKVCQLGVAPCKVLR